MTTPDLQHRPVLASHVRLRIDPIDGSPILLFPEGMLILNQTAHEIVRRCDGRLSIAEMLRILAEEFDVGEEVLLNDLLENLNHLRQRNLILFSP